MSIAAWRRLLLGLCACALLQLAYDVTVQTTRFSAMPGFDVEFFGPVPGASSVEQRPTSIPQVYTLTFPPSNALADTGIESGDLLDLRTVSPSDRYRWRTHYWWLGEHVDAPIIHHGVLRAVPLTAHWWPLLWIGTIANAGICWTLLFATIVAWRRPDDPQARALALLLIVYNMGLDFQPQNWITPWPWLDATLAAVSGPLTCGGLVLYTTYAMLFARPASRTRRILAGASYVVAAVLSVIGLAAPALFAFAPLVFSNAFRSWCLNAPPTAFIFPALCVIATIPATSGIERARIAWTSVALLPYYLIYSVPAFAVSEAVYDFSLYPSNIIIFLAPVGLTYSLLNPRLLDVGFALNRAAVFTISSLLLAGLFAALQWAANTFIAGIVRVHNVVVDMTIVIIIYVLARFSRDAVERFITRLFFATRDRRLHALSDLSRAVDDVSEADAVAPFVVEYLRTRVGIAGCVYLQAGDDSFEPASGEGGPPAIARDHVAAVALRSARTAMTAPEWTELGTAFPMLVRGRLRGILFCRAPNDVDFAPDETRALEYLANHMASDREDLLAESLRAELRELRRGRVSLA